jgi:hypothetical protein
MKKVLLSFAMVVAVLSIIISSFDLSLARSGGWEQCGGLNWTGSTTCPAGWHCYSENEYFSQCIPGSDGTIVECRTGSDCQAGGCGSSSCSIKSPDLPLGGGAEKSVTAQQGYYACCWKESLSGNLYAKSFSNKCCQ